MPTQLMIQQDLDRKIWDLKLELNRLLVEQPAVEKEIGALVLKMRYFASDEERAQLELLEGQLQANREHVEQITQDLANAETERVETGKKEFERFETERRELAKQLADRARAVIAARKSVTKKRVQLLPMFEELARELNEGALVEYLKLHREFVTACRKLKETEHNLSGNEHFSPAVEALIDKVEAEAGPRPEGPQRTAKELENLFKTLQFICHGSGAEKVKISLWPLGPNGW